MSWCRWSTELPNGKTSALYVYESIDSCITVHVAGRKRVGEEFAPKNLTLSQETIEDGSFMAQHLLVQDWYDNFEKNGGVWENLPDKYRGQTVQFSYKDKDGFIEFLNECKKYGIEFPEYLYEMAEESFLRTQDREQ